MKNNLAVVISILNMQSARVDDTRAKNALRDCHDRVKAMALIHETLHKSENLAEISCRDYGERLVTSLSRVVMGGTIKLVATFCDEPLHIDHTVPVGLIINELVTNAIQHAYPGQHRGEIRIGIQALDDDRLELVVSDDGIGLPAELDPLTASPLGLRMVVGLAENQLGGTFEINREQGTTYTIRFRRRTRPVEPAGADSGGGA